LHLTLLSKLSLLPRLLGRKSFLARIFALDVVPFQSKEVRPFFGPWTTIQESGSNLLFDVISVFHSHVGQDRYL